MSETPVTVSSDEVAGQPSVMDHLAESQSLSIEPSHETPLPLDQIDRSPFPFMNLYTG